MKNIYDFLEGLSNMTSSANHVNGFENPFNAKLFKTTNHNMVIVKVAINPTWP